MRELVGSKNTIGQMASVLKKLQKATLPLPLYLSKVKVEQRLNHYATPGPLYLIPIINIFTSNVASNSVPAVLASK